jgi:site-specific DNA recombinase
MSRVAIYVRQSQDKTGTEAGVDRQEAACRSLAEAKGWDDLVLYRDNDKSATSGKQRPEFERLVQDIENGTVNALLVYHLDRLTRSIKDLTRVIEAGRNQRVNIASVHGVSLDLGDPTGVAVATILTAIAAMEVAHKGTRQKTANRQRAIQGKAHWVKRPFGYEREGDIVRVVPDEAEALREAADSVLAGDTLASIARDWNERGSLSTSGKPWTVTSIRRTLLNPRTAGRRLYNGEDLGAGVWEPIFSEDLHKALEAKLLDPRRKTAPDDTNSKYLLSGIALCGKCGKKMFASPVKAGGRHYMVYRCFGGYCMTRRLDLVDHVVEQNIIGYLSEPVWHDLFEDEADVKKLRLELQALILRQEALASLLADGLLSPSSVRQQAGALTSKIRALNDSIDAAEGDSPLSVVIGSTDVAAAWRDLPLSAKRRILRALISVTVLPAGKGVRFNEGQVSIERVDGPV